MIKKLIIFFALLPALVVGQRKTLNVELIDYTAEKIPAYCGYKPEWGVLKFKVQAPSTNFRIGEIILALFQCPRETMENGLGLENYVNHKLFILTIGEKVEINDILAKATNMFPKADRENFPYFWLTKLELGK